MMHKKTSVPHKPAVALDCRIEAGDWPEIGILEALAETTFNAVTGNASFRRACTLLEGSEVSILFTDDDHITAINFEFRDQKKPTNVLSFPQAPADSEVFGPYLGDIVLAFETVFREAGLESKVPTHHLQHLLVHGFLHLVGYDHVSDEEAEAMESLERDILRDLGIDDPYKDYEDMIEQ